MDELIEALKILKQCLKNPDNKYPTACEHDVLFVCSVDMSKVTVDIVRKLATLGFIPGDGDSDYNYYPEETKKFDFKWENCSEELWNATKNEIDNCFHSYKYGSC
jgi:hypothetical protein